MLNFAKETINKLRSIFAMNRNRKSMDLNKEAYRGTLKQIMKVRGLRTISLDNYNVWKGNERNTEGIHSIKLDVQSGYINIFGYGFTKKGNPTCSGVAIEDASAETYRTVYNQVLQILSEEKANVIPYKVRKNILVRVAR